MNLVEIGSRIKTERKNRGISQEKLAETISVTPHYIYEIERGMKAMSLETLINISEAIEISTDYILFGSGKNKSTSLFEQLNTMGGDRRLRAESAFMALLPYIK